MYVIWCVPIRKDLNVYLIVAVLCRCTLLKQAVTTYHRVYLIIGIVTGSKHVNTIISLYVM